MNTAAERDLLGICRTRIADQLQLGAESGKLRNRDFEYLADCIEERSGVKLSVSTLKRIWKKGYDKTPHPATLNALAAVLGHEDWQAFKQEASQEEPHESSAVQEAKSYVPVILPLIVLSLLLVLLFNQDEQNPLSRFIPTGRSVKVNTAVLFTADKMESAGVPNSVIFHYDLSGVEADSFFIQQSWNPRHKVRIDPDKNHFSTIYYTPGFHFARLIANDSVLKFQPIHITSEDWLGIVKYDRRELIPVYLPSNEIWKDGSLRVSPQVLTDAGIDPEREFFVRYYQVKDFGAITLDNFRLSTRMRIDSFQQSVCPYMEIMILAEQDVSYLQFSPKGCVANLDMLIGEQYFSGGNADLSSFGTDVYHWQDIAVTVREKQAIIHLNGREIFQTDFEKDFGRIVGLILTFKGTGAVEYVELDDSRIVGRR